MTGCALLRRSISALVLGSAFSICISRFAETGRVPDEFNKPVFQHNLTLLVAAAVTF